jgi:hypothetical protein
LCRISGYHTNPCRYPGVFPDFPGINHNYSAGYLLMLLNPGPPRGYKKISDGIPAYYNKGSIRCGNIENQYLFIRKGITERD